MRIKILLGILLAVLAGVGIWRLSSDRTPSPDAIVTDNSANAESGRTVAAGEPVVEELPAVNRDEQVASGTPPVVGENIVPAPDGSQIWTSNDSYGTQIQTRTFYNNPRITIVVAKTYTDGRRLVQVYNHKGEIRMLPDLMSSQAMQASGNSLADAVNFYEVKERKIPDAKSVEPDAPKAISAQPGDAGAKPSGE